MDGGFVILRFRMPLAVNSKGCMNSNTAILMNKTRWFYSKKQRSVFGK